MKKLIMICIVLSMILVVGLPASEALTYKFDPNDLIDLWAAGAPNPDDTINPPSAYPRSIYDPGVSQGYPAYTGIGAWNTEGTGSDLDTAIGTDFNAWRNTNGGFITSFNTGLADSPKARGWGETTVVKLNTSATATAAAGWSVVIEPNEWYPDQIYVIWTADSDAYALSAEGPDIGEFSFSLDLYWDVNENNWDKDDPLVQLGETPTIWFGGYGVADNSFAYGAEYYGTSANGLLYQGTLDITAVPEPGTMMLIGSLATGLFGIAAVRKKRR